MCLAGLDLFQWWAATITAGSIFLALVGVYLYVDSRKRRRNVHQKRGTNLKRVLTDFVFVWVLLGLLVFYIVSIDIGSDMIFAVGNVLVEALLLLYLILNWKRGPKET
jgi:hypothetical protein